MAEAQDSNNGSANSEEGSQSADEPSKVEPEQVVDDGSKAECGSLEESIVAEVTAQKLELAESRDRYVRLMADFENFKKRSLKEQSELLKYQGERLVVDLLEVLDNLELALSFSSAEFDKLKTGLDMVHKLFVERLAKWDIRGESGVGASFDPQKHAAISRVPGADVAPGTIVGELKKAYFYKDKLIRHGEVVVATDGE